VIMYRMYGMPRAQDAQERRATGDYVQDDVQGCTNVAMIWISKSDRTNAASTGRLTWMC